MNKRGIISISVIYSFFIVFITVVLGIVALYTTRGFLMKELKNDARKSIKETFQEAESDSYMREKILSDYGGKSAITEVLDFSVVETGLYKTQDNYGTSYYFRGNPINNYVKFGIDSAGNDLYWRILRINGDGSIRIIYDGTSLVNNGETHNTVVDKSSTEMQEGWNPGEAVHITGTWYRETLQTNYQIFIADRYFCENQEKAIGGNINDLSDYSLACLNIYSFTKSSYEGNGYANSLARHLSAEEAIFAGLSKNSSSKTYLYTGESFWTTTPYNENYFWAIKGDKLEKTVNTESIGIRPVINLKANVKFSGLGIITAPYEIYY